MAWQLAQAPPTPRRTEGDDVKVAIFRLLTSLNTDTALACKDNIMKIIYVKLLIIKYNFELCI